MQTALSILLPGLGWVAILFIRPSVTELHCMIHPADCVVSSIFFLDRVAVNLVNPKADYLSFLSNYILISLACLIPLLWEVTRFRRPQFWKCIGTDYFLMFKTIVWNGFLTEISRILIQRPRPFVYLDPPELGKNAAHYTSFYSGHTSFAAGLATAVLFILLHRNAPKWVLYPITGCMYFLVLTTGTTRVLAGRHFPTDAVGAVFIGTFVAILVAKASGFAKRDRLPEMKQS